MAETTKQTALERMQASNEHGITKEQQEKLGYRTKASAQWVAHYIKVADLKEAFMKENPEALFTAKVAEELLVTSWETKEETKESVGI